LASSWLDSSWILSSPAFWLSVRSSSPVSTFSIPGVDGTWSTASSSESTTNTTSICSPLPSSARCDDISTGLVSAWNLGLVGGLLILLSFWVAVEVQIGHDVPFGFTGCESSTETEDFTGKHPPDETDSVTALVVGWDGNIDVLGWGIGVAEGNDWDVDVGSFLDSLGIGAWVGDNDETWFLEGAGDVVGEVTGGEATSDGDSTSVSGEL
jgi:hypothetical protein